MYLFLIMFTLSLLCLGWFNIDALGFDVLVYNDFFYTFNDLMLGLTCKFDIPMAVDAFQKMLHGLGAVFSHSRSGALLLVLYFLFMLILLDLIKWHACGLPMTFKSGYPDFYIDNAKLAITYSVMTLIYTLITVVYFLVCVFVLYGLMLLLMSWGASKALLYVVFVLIVLLCKTDKNALLSGILPRTIFERRCSFALIKDEIVSVYSHVKENYISALVLALIQVSSTILAGAFLHVWGFVLAYWLNNFIYMSYGLNKYYYNSGTPYTFKKVKHNITAEPTIDNKNEKK